MDPRYQQQYYQYYGGPVPSTSYAPQPVYQAAPRALPQVPRSLPQGPPPIPHASRPAANSRPARYTRQESSDDDDLSQQIQALKLKQASIPTFSYNEDPPLVQIDETPPIPVIEVKEPPSSGPSFSISVAPPSPKASKPSYVPKLIVDEPSDAPPPPRKPSSALPTTQSLANDMVCAGCQLPINGKILSALERRWHPDCFTCAYCRESLEHVAFFDYEGKPYCHFDYHEQFSLRCHHCKTPIVDETYVTLDVPVLGLRYYHDLHFFCSQCGDPFMDPKSLRKITSQVNEDAPQPLAKPFVVHDGWPYCETCMVNLHSPRCQACKKPIVDEVIKADGKQYHPECFVCVECGNPFEEAYLLKEGQPHHMECYKLALLRTL